MWIFLLLFSLTIIKVKHDPMIYPCKFDENPRRVQYVFSSDFMYTRNCHVDTHGNVNINTNEIQSKTICPTSFTFGAAT